jgi:hypothetical protein
MGRSMCGSWRRMLIEFGFLPKATLRERLRSTNLNAMPVAPGYPYGRLCQRLRVAVLNPRSSGFDEGCVRSSKS